MSHRRAVDLMGPATRTGARESGRSGDDLSWRARGEGWLDGDSFVFEGAPERHHRSLSDAEEAGGALGRHAIALEERHALEAPALAALAGTAFQPGMALESALLTTYTSGRGELGKSSRFNINIDFEGDWTPELQQRFVVAAEYLSAIIRGDLRDRAGIDDIAIKATLSDIDGPGGVLGQAGPTALRAASALPFRGEMEFDLADAAGYDGQGLFDDIVIHEMIHALGFGTVWGRMDLTHGAAFLDGLLFTGRNAQAAFKSLFPKVHDDASWFRKGVPLETDGGPGTADGHWDEDTFHRELMTGYLDRRAYVSPMTVAALEDMGYRTVFDADQPHRAIPQPDDFL